MIDRQAILDALHGIGLCDGGPCQHDESGDLTDVNAIIQVVMGDAPRYEKVPYARSHFIHDATRKCALTGQEHHACFLQTWPES